MHSRARNLEINREKEKDITRKGGLTRDPEAPSEPEAPEILTGHVERDHVLHGGHGQAGVLGAAEELAVVVAAPRDQAQHAHRHVVLPRHLRTQGALGNLDWLLGGWSSRAHARPRVHA